LGKGKGTDVSNEIVPRPKAGKKRNWTARAWLQVMSSFGNPKKGQKARNKERGTKRPYALKWLTFTSERGPEARWNWGVPNRMGLEKAHILLGLTVEKADARKEVTFPSDCLPKEGVRRNLHRKRGPKRGTGLWLRNELSGREVLGFSEIKGTLFLARIGLWG